MYFLEEHHHNNGKKAPRRRNFKTLFFLLVPLLLGVAIVCFQIRVFAKTQTILNTLMQLEGHFPIDADFTTPLYNVSDPNRRTIDNIDSHPNNSSCPSLLPEEEIRTTLVTQTSSDRVWILNEHCRRWKDPLVVVVAIQYKGFAPQATVAEVKRNCPQLKIFEYQLDREQSQPGRYPVNMLRNVGLDGVETSHVLTADVDFIPSDRLDETIRATVQDRQRTRSKGGTEQEEAIVVPAFSRIIQDPCSTIPECRNYLQKNSSFIPKTFKQLATCVSEKECDVFHSIFPPAHSTTNSENWLKSKWYEGEPLQNTGEEERSTKAIKSIDCFHSQFYEPYIVVRHCPAITSSASNSIAPKPVAPYYDERFVGYGMNKIQGVLHMREMGYKFLILPEGFLVHHPHPASSSREVFRDKNNPSLKKEMGQLLTRFKRSLREIYADRRALVTPFCMRIVKADGTSHFGKDWLRERKRGAKGGRIIIKTKA